MTVPHKTPLCMIMAVLIASHHRDSLKLWSWALEAPASCHAEVVACPSASPMPPDTPPDGPNSSGCEATLLALKAFRGTLTEAASDICLVLLLLLLILLLLLLLLPILLVLLLVFFVDYYEYYSY